MPAPELPIPIIDVSVVDQKAADQMLEAASTSGFLFIEGHDFTADEVNEAFQLSRQFFSLPLEQKNVVPISPQNFGFCAMNDEALDVKAFSYSKKGDPKEGFNFGLLENGVPTHDLPDFFAERKDKIVHLIRKLQDLNLRVLRLLSMGLHIDEAEGGSEWLPSRHNPSGKSSSVFRMLYYPGQKSADPEEEIRAGAHSDYGAITLLFQKENEEGLEILSPVTKKWTPVPYVGTAREGMAPPLIMNIGDMLSYWTSGVLRSTVHRVKFPKEAQESGKDRYSIVFFSQPEDDVPLVPVPSDVTRGVSGRGANSEKNVITAKEYLQRKLDASYGWEKEKEKDN